jgi:Mg/Co/Ni transporter MgtE
MRPWRPALSPHEDLRSAIESLTTRHESHAPVIDGTGLLLGVLREEDCLRFLSSSAYGELESGDVGEHMSRVAVSLDEEMDLFRVAEAFLHSRETVLPVLRRSGRLVGRITRQEVVREVCRFDDAVLLERRRYEQQLWTREHPSSIDSLQRLARDHTPQQLVEVLRNRPRYRRRD